LTSNNSNSNDDEKKKQKKKETEKERIKRGMLNNKQKKPSPQKGKPSTCRLRPSNEMGWATWQKMTLDSDILYISIFLS
jgi:hypothetical protein